MKNLLFVFISLITFANVSYASFPVVGNNTTLALESEESEGDEFSLFEAILVGVFAVSILGFAAFFLFKAWWRAWRDNIRWVKILTYIFLVLCLIFLLLLLIGMAIYSNGPMM